MIRSSAKRRFLAVGFVVTGLCAGVGTSAAQDVKPRESKARTQSAQDVRKMQTLAKDVRATLEKSKHNVLSLSTLKSLDEIGTLSRTVRGRLKGK